MNKELTNYSLQKGLYAGLIQGIFYLACYFINRSLFGSFSIGFLTILFVLIYPLVVTIRYRKRHGNILILKDSFLMLFIISFVRGLIASLFFIIIFNVIDPDLSTFIKDKVIQNTTEMLQNFGTPEDKINETIEKLQNEPDQFSLSKQLVGILISIPVIALFSVLGAAIIKRNPTPFTEPVN